MKKHLSLFILLLPFVFAPLFAFASVSLVDRVRGKILLRVEGKGEAWYVNPDDGKRYLLGRPADAFKLMRELGMGISNNDLAKLPIASPSEQLPQWKTYWNDIFSFGFQYPQNWNVVHDENFQAHGFFVQNDKGKRIVAILPQGEFDYGLPIEEPQAVTIDFAGTKAIHKKWNGMEMIQLLNVNAFYNWRNDNRIEIAYNDENRETVQKILNSLYILNGEEIYFTGRLKGKILLQVESKGEAWYVNPEDRRRYYMGRPYDAFNLMKIFGVGIKDKDLFQIPLAPAYHDETEIKYSTYDINILKNEILIKDNPEITNSKKYLTPDYYRIAQEIKSPYSDKIAVLVCLDDIKSGRCVYWPHILFYIKEGKLGENYFRLHGALEHMYIDDVIWKSDGWIQFHKFGVDEGGSNKEVRFLYTP